MRVETVQIAWHVGENGKNDPILSADFWGRQVLATAGADSEVKLWNVQVVEGKVKVVFTMSLARHEKTVNVVRFSPDGTMLASAGDDQVVLVWKLDRSRVSHWGQVSEERDLLLTRLTGHSADVYDLAWSPDSQHLVSGSIDHSTLLWSVSKGALLKQQRDHSHYVQGVAWDPLNRFVVSQSCDRSCRVYALTHRALPGHAEGAAEAAQLEADAKAGVHRVVTRVAGAACKHVIARRAFPQAPADGEGAAEAAPAEPPAGAKPRRSHKMYMDETVTSFFRRPAFSPDGALLVTPAGVFHADAAAPGRPTSYVFARDDFATPALHLPGPAQATVGARFAPVLLRLAAAAEGTTAAVVQLPYRAVFAVSSLDGVYVYDTQHAFPIAAAEHIHYAALTDLAWNADASLLCVTSSDGYCTFLAFAEGEIGEPLPLPEYPESMRNRVAPLPPGAVAAVKESKTGVAAAGAAPAPAPTSGEPLPASGEVGAAGHQAAPHSTPAAVADAAGPGPATDPTVQQAAASHEPGAANGVPP